MNVLTPRGVNAMQLETKFLRLRTPVVAPVVVVALDDETIFRVAADDAVDHDDPGAEVTLRHLVRDDLTLRVGLGLCVLPFRAVCLCRLRRMIAAAMPTTM